MGVIKIAINTCYGGFSVSEAVYAELGLEWDGYGFLENKDFGIESECDDEYRSHQKLIAAIEKIGTKESSGVHADINIVEINWRISSHDGIEDVKVSDYIF